MLLDFILLKAAAVRGHNSRETCLAFSVRALHGISNVTQSLSPLAFHSFIYGLGQQWSKKFIKKRWLLGALCEMALGRSCCAPAPTGSLNQGMRPHHIVTHMGTFPDHVHVVEVLDKVLSGLWEEMRGSMVKSLLGLGVCTGHP